VGYTHEKCELSSAFHDAILQYKITFEQNYIRIIKIFYNLIVSFIYWVN